MEQLLEPASRPAAQTVEIGDEAAGQRIDNWLLGRLKDWPRSRVYQLLRSGQVRINMGRIGPSYRLLAGDKLRLPPQAAQAAAENPSAAHAAPPARWAQQRLLDAVLFEDQDILVVDKPAGFAVHGGSGIAHGVIETLRATRPDGGFLELVHRIDRETSGCLVLAKNRAALTELHRQFRDGEIEKRYLALVVGFWRLGDHRADLPLEIEHRRDGERHVRVEEGSKSARTDFRLVQHYGSYSLLEAMPHTGRTHQIRVHAQALGHPLAGDERYGDPGDNERLTRLGLRRLFLHAHMLSFRHPRTQQPESISTPLPEELGSVLDRLNSGAARSRPLPWGSRRTKRR